MLNKARNLIEDTMLWAVLAVFCMALLIDYICGTRITEWLI